MYLAQHVVQKGRIKYIKVREVTRNSGHLTLSPRGSLKDAPSRARSFPPGRRNETEPLDMLKIAFMGTLFEIGKTPRERTEKHKPTISNSRPTFSKSHRGP